MRNIEAVSEHTATSHFFLDIAGHLAYECMTLGHNLTFIRFFAVTRA